MSDPLRLLEALRAALSKPGVFATLSPADQERAIDALLLPAVVVNQILEEPGGMQEFRRCLKALTNQDLATIGQFIRDHSGHFTRAALVTVDVEREVARRQELDVH